MKLEIIGRDPKLTMQINKMVGARAEKERKRKQVAASIIMPFAIVSKWIGGLR